MHFNLEDHTILLTVGGSRAYGMHTPTSDIDVKGIAIAPESATLGFAFNYEQTDGKGAVDVFRPLLKEADQKLAENGFEGVVYDLRKFFALASKGNPNILEVLFCDENDILHMTADGLKLRDHRDLFLSQVVRYSYTGYAVAQLKSLRHN